VRAGGGRAEGGAAAWAGELALRAEAELGGGGAEGLARRAAGGASGSTGPKLGLRSEAVGLACARGGAARLGQVEWRPRADGWRAG
jgi:hypothetical protein